MNDISELWTVKAEAFDEERPDVARSDDSALYILASVAKRRAQGNHRSQQARTHPQDATKGAMIWFDELAA